jgi:hypothetical protein
MPSFRVKFFNTLLGSDGHCHRVLQRAIELKEPGTTKDAMELAQRDFERLECVPDWRLHAQCCEVETKDDNLAGVQRPHRSD